MPPGGQTLPRLGAGRIRCELIDSFRRPPLHCILLNLGNAAPSTKCRIDNHHEPPQAPAERLRWCDAPETEIETQDAARSNRDDPGNGAREERLPELPCPAD